MKRMNNKWHLFGIICLLFLFSSSLLAQEDKEALKQKKEARMLLDMANKELQENAFPLAEARYRKAIDLNPVDETGKYNLGNAYYNKEMHEQALRRYAQAAEVADTKAEKHQSFHNLGNAYMKAKKYQEAVEAYKNALRNDPTDEETRYNLALAKEMLEKNPPQGGGDDKKDEKEQQDKDDQQENKDDEGEDKEGDEGDEKENKDEGEEKDDEKKGDQQKDKGKPQQPEEGKGEQPKQQQPVPGQLSPQQVKNLLEAMNNEEKKVQDKINAQKLKGAKVKSEKDW